MLTPPTPTPNSEPSIPEKRYFTISEVSQLCAVKAHVLRYWEHEFAELHPAKRRGNRRYYQRADVLIIRQIKTLLYQQGFTIAGARQQLLQETGLQDGSHIPLSSEHNPEHHLQQIIYELQSVLGLLDGKS